MGIWTSHLAEGLNRACFPRGTWSLARTGMALPPALPYPACRRWLDLHSTTAFGPETGNQLKIFANYQTVLFEQTRLSEFINSTNYERMQRCIYNENIKQIKSSTMAELNTHTLKGKETHPVTTAL